MLQKQIFNVCNYFFCFFLNHLAMKAISGSYIYEIVTIFSILMSQLSSPPPLSNILEILGNRTIRSFSAHYIVILQIFYFFMTWRVRSKAVFYIL